MTMKAATMTANRGISLPALVHTQRLCSCLRVVATVIAFKKVSSHSHHLRSSRRRVWLACWRHSRRIATISTRMSNSCCGTSGVVRKILKDSRVLRSQWPASSPKDLPCRTKQRLYPLSEVGTSIFSRIQYILFAYFFAPNTAHKSPDFPIQSTHFRFRFR